MSVKIEQVLNGESIKVYAQQSLKYGWVSVSRCREMDGYVLMGEAEIVFNSVDRNEAIQKAAEMLDRQIQETYAKAELEVSRIKDQKAQLLALTCDTKVENKE